MLPKCVWGRCKALSVISSDVGYVGVSHDRNVQDSETLF